MNVTISYLTFAVLSLTLSVHAREGHRRFLAIVIPDPMWDYEYILVMCSKHSNGERASPVNLKSVG